MAITYNKTYLTEMINDLQFWIEAVLNNIKRNEFGENPT